MAKKEKKEKKEKKGFFKEFKEFISRGNVFDMAVGIIIGGAFTAIVTALCDHVLKPIINWVIAAIVGADGLEGVYTFLNKAFVLDELGNPTTTIDLVNSIYIDWGALINAIINFLLIALVLFLIIKIINHVRRIGDAAKASAVEAAERRREQREEEEKKAAEEAAAKEANVAAPVEAAAEKAPAAESEEPSEQNPSQEE